MYKKRRIIAIFFFMAFAIIPAAHELGFKRTMGSLANIWQYPNRFEIDWFIFDEDLQFLFDFQLESHEPEDIVEAINSKKGEFELHLKDRLYLKSSNQKIAPQIQDVQFEEPAYIKLKLLFEFKNISEPKKLLNFFYLYEHDTFGRDRLNIAYYSEDKHDQEPMVGYLHGIRKQLSINSQDNFIKNQEIQSLRKDGIPTNIIFSFAVALCLFILPWKKFI